MEKIYDTYYEVCYDKKGKVAWFGGKLEIAQDLVRKHGKVNHLYYDTRFCSTSTDQIWPIDKISHGEIILL